jgi:hypothetical protein
VAKQAAIVLALIYLATDSPIGKAGARVAGRATVAKLGNTRSSDVTLVRDATTSVPWPVSEKFPIGKIIEFLWALTHETAARLFNEQHANK